MRKQKSSRKSNLLMTSGTSSLRIGERVITPPSNTYIIAEIGINHEGSISKAIRLFDLAVEGGADAVKFQSYKARPLASVHSPAYWDLAQEPTVNQLQLFQKYDSFEPEDYRFLARHCEKEGIDFSCTPFDDEAVDFLDELNPFLKIASAGVTNFPLLRKIGKKHKPVLLSTGASTKVEIREAVGVLEAAGAQDVCVMHCILSYPTKDHDASRRMIGDLKLSFPGSIIGYSDHTAPQEKLLALGSAYSLSAVIIEKHFTDDKSLPGNNHYHSMDSADLRDFRTWVRGVVNLLGTEFEKKPIETELAARENARRALWLHAIWRRVQSWSGRT